MQTLSLISGLSSGGGLAFECLHLGFQLGVGLLEVVDAAASSAACVSISFSFFQLAR